MDTPLVIVGAGLSGLRAAEQVRAAGWSGHVVVIGAEEHLPYNRPPLSKEALSNGIAHDTLAFRRKPSVDDVEWRLGRRVSSVDLTDRVLELDDGPAQPYRGLVAATGVRPRRLPLEAPLEWRHVLRTLEDATQLRARLVEGGQVVIIGAGFVGCEVAATARGLGCDVALVDPLPSPMLKAVGDVMGDELRRRHEAHGVRFHLGRTVTTIEGSAGPTGVVLDDGDRLDADVIVEAVGSVPNVEWLAGNGLNLDDGVECDNRLHPMGPDGPIRDVVVVGDIARFTNPRFGKTPYRVEHWSMPTSTGRRAARSLVQHLDGDPADVVEFAPLPTFWSDQYDIRLQSFGLPELGRTDIRVLEGDLQGDVAVGYHHGDELVGVVLLGLPKRLRHYRELLSERTP